MLIQPKRRKILKYQKMDEVGLSKQKAQCLFILNEITISSYNDLIESFSNENCEINIVSRLDNFYKDKRFNYFEISDLDWLFEVCEYSYCVNDERILIYDLEDIDKTQINSIGSKKYEVREDEVSIILSHSNTEEKRQVLIECIESLKIKGQKIILASHINVDDEILNLVDFFVFDKRNRLIGPDEFEGKSRTWAYFSYPGYYHEWNYPNHALAVLDLMKCSVGVAISNGFRVAHLIHYDCILYDDSILNTHYNKLNKFDIYHYYYQGYESRMDGNFFSVVTDKFLSKIFRINKKEDFAIFEIAIFESFLKNLFYDADLRIGSCVIESLFYKNIIDKIKMISLQHEKEYPDGPTTQTYIVASQKGDDKYITISTDDINVDHALIDGVSYRIIVNQINVFKINDFLLEGNISVNIPQVELKQILDKNIKYANCIKIEPEIINFFDLTL